MRITALKFGGSSLADAAQFEKVASIIKSHVGKVFVVASAPGKRSKEDTKVTDMLYSCYDSASSGEDFKNAFDAIKQRFQSIVDGLGLAFGCTPAGNENTWCGQYDEIRLRGGTLSADRIKADYDMIKNRNFLIYSAVESGKGVAE